MPGLVACATLQGPAVAVSRFRMLLRRRRRASCGWQVLISEYLAKLMIVKEERSGEITALAQAIGTALPPLAEASGATKYEKILNMSLAIAALVQGTACTTQQIKALRWVSEELERSAKDGKSSSFSHSIFFDDPWWASLLRRIWSFAADEGTAASQIAKIVSALEAETVAHVDEAWSLAKSRMLRWKQTLREGALEPDLRAFLRRTARSKSHS